MDSARAAGLSRTQQHQLCIYIYVFIYETRVICIQLADSKSISWLSKLSRSHHLRQVLAALGGQPSGARRAHLAGRLSLASQVSRKPLAREMKI